MSEQDAAGATVRLVTLRCPQCGGRLRYEALMDAQEAYLTDRDCACPLSVDETVDLEDAALAEDGPAEESSTQDGPASEQEAAGATPEHPWGVAPIQRVEDALTNEWMYVKAEQMRQEFRKRTTPAGSLARGHSLRDEHLRGRSYTLRRIAEALEMDAERIEGHAIAAAVGLTMDEDGGR
jgi:hypothetical protein